MPNRFGGLAGSGEAHTEGTVQRFGATPVLTRLPDGSALELPWRS